MRLLRLRSSVLGGGALAACRRSSSSAGAVAYVQGQSPEPKVREYFYYVDHQGQLFLDDTKVKNFVTCFKDVHFLVFFFSRLKANRSGRYQDHFPFLSLCGRERNFLRCDDRPVVFTHLLPGTGPGPGRDRLSFCGGGQQLSVPFRPEALYMEPGSGRLYHPCPDRAGGVGLVRSALAIELSPSLVYAATEKQSGPSHVVWGGARLQLTNELAARFHPEEAES
ncbi:UPF0598 protein C8orf82 homolog isoform X1 [Synchiropus splendidus]|uniref:UPF0598 protein C8orf82 homolog isoform X1 n=1 Tax=Synchiropus splendidus TaxID=270530 RepID=UPI00237DAF19|nr:UPF0598 protein C8orf82 homolog isoform X1 [Synchiropus splendidus]